MKRIILISLVLISFTLKAQDFDKIKDQNVFFILFDEAHDSMKKRTLSIKNKDNLEVKAETLYYFYKKNNEKFEFSFDYWDYRSFDDAYNKINKRMIYRLNKSFLRKNKDIIITRDFMEEVGEDAIIDLLFRGSKYIFLIDKAEVKKGEILLREVRFNYTALE